MNWINTVVRPKIRSFLNRPDTPENLWIKCPVTGEMVFHRDLEANQYVIPNSGFHMRIDASQRFGFFFDEGEYDLIDLPDVAQDPLKFRDTKRYTDRIRDAKAKTGYKDSVLIAQGKVEGLFLTVGVQDFSFLGGSLGLAAGEALVTGMMKAVEDKTPFVLFTSSGGARMQEGILSLMQMPRTTVAVQALRDAGLPYIVVLCDPTTGGVTASYAMLGDIHLAEPGALIGFAGQRVIEQTIREKLPEGFQRAEYLEEHGMVDMVVHRHDLPKIIARLCRFFTHQDLPLPDPVSKKTDSPTDEANAPESDEPSVTAEAMQPEVSDIPPKDVDEAEEPAAQSDAPVEEPAQEEEEKSSDEAGLDKDKKAE